MLLNDKLSHGWTAPLGEHNTWQEAQRCFDLFWYQGLVVFLLAVASCGPVAEPEPPSGPIPDIGAMVATAIHAALQPTVENEGQESSPSGDESQIKSAGAAQAPTRTDWTAAAGWTALKENPESPTSASSAGPTVPAPRATPTRRIKPTPTRIRIYVPTLTPTRRVTPTPTPSIVSKHSGSCWTEGEGYTVVTNGRGNRTLWSPFNCVIFQALVIVALRRFEGRFETRHGSGHVQSSLGIPRGWRIARVLQAVRQRIHAWN